MSEQSAFTDPKTQKAPTINLFQASGYEALLTNRGVTLEADMGHGVKLAVCQLATRAVASLAAQKTGGKVDDIFKELVENRWPAAHMVPAGIVAVNRAQERGYTFSYSSR